MFQYLPFQKDDLVAIQCTGKFDREDLDALLPEMEKRMAQYGRIRFYWEMVSFSGWTAAGFLQDRLFDLKHRKDFGKIAMVGEKDWQEKAAALMDRFFSGAEVRFFDVHQKEDARQWIGE